MKWLKTLIIGKGRNLSDKDLFHKVSLIAVLAWVGLGADGLSSSCYGPEEAFKALGTHTALSLFVGLATVITITIICASYSQIIELFPGGGGGYLVSSKLLSPSAGVVSGCALLVDYVLTIAISIASGADALFSVLPTAWHAWKIAFILIVTLFLTVLNMRGVKESVLIWAPVFFVFLGTHAFAILFAITTHLGALPEIAGNFASDVRATHTQLGWTGLFLLLIRSYSVGAGTYTGIEAVSNGLPILREPRAATGKRTMVYMGVSLAITVSGLFLAYMLYNVSPQSGKTLNAVLFEQMTSHWPHGLAKIFVSVSMLSAMALLIIAAQAGFLDGPRVLANMAHDRWFPSRFSMLSNRLVAQNGIMLMGGTAMLLLLATNGSVGFMVVLYSINVFITFSLSQLGMVRHWWKNRTSSPKWLHKLAINGIGFFLTASILVMLNLTKFWEGGWITLLVTGCFIGIAFYTNWYYRNTMKALSRLDVLVQAFDAEVSSKNGPEKSPEPPCDPSAKTAVIFVNGFNGLGLHTIMSIMRLFPGVYRNFIFVQVGTLDTGNFKGTAEIENLKQHIKNEVSRYAWHMQKRGYCTETVTDIGTDIVETASGLASQIAQRYPHATFFGGQLVFPKESWLTRLLHNFVVFALQRQIFRQGLPFLIVPIRV